MCASKMGYGAATSRGSPTRSRTAASETSEPRAVIAGILSRGRSRDPGRSAYAAGTVADAPGVAKGGEDDAMLLGDAPVVSAAAPADDSRRRATDVHRHREERPAAREVLPELLVRLLGVAARAPRLRAHTSPRPEARDAAVGRLDAESVGERLEFRRASVEPPEKADERVAP